MSLNPSNLTLFTNSFRFSIKIHVCVNVSWDFSVLPVIKTSKSKSLSTYRNIFCSRFTPKNFSIKSAETTFDEICFRPNKSLKNLSASSSEFNSTAICSIFRSQHTLVYLFKLNPILNIIITTCFWNN